MSNQCWILVGRIVDGNTTKKYILTSNNGQYNQITKKGLDRFFRENTVLNASASNNSIQCKGMSATQLPKYVINKQFGMTQVSGLSEQEIIELSQPLFQQWQAKQIRKAQGNQDNSKLQYIINKLDIIRGLIEQSIQMKELTNAFAENGELTRYLKQIDIDNAEGDSLESLIKNRGVNGLADGLQNRLKSLHNRAQKYNLQSKEYDGVTISKACSILNKQCEEIRRLHIETKKLIKLNKEQETNEEELVEVSVDDNEVSFDSLEDITEDAVEVQVDDTAEEEPNFDEVEELQDNKEELLEWDVDDCNNIAKEIEHRIKADLEKPFDKSKAYEALKDSLKSIKKSNFEQFRVNSSNDNIKDLLTEFLINNIDIDGLEYEVSVKSYWKTYKINIGSTFYHHEIGWSIYNKVNYSRGLNIGDPSSAKRSIIKNKIEYQGINELDEVCRSKIEKALNKFAQSIYDDDKKKEEEAIQREIDNRPENVLLRKVKKELEGPFDETALHKELRRRLKGITVENALDFVITNDHGVLLGLETFYKEKTDCHIGISSSILNELKTSVTIPYEIGVDIFKRAYDVTEEVASTVYLKVWEETNKLLANKMERALDKISKSVKDNYKHEYDKRKEAEKKRLKEEREAIERKRKHIIEQYCSKYWEREGWSYAHAYEMDDIYNEAYYSAQKKDFKKYYSMTDEEFEEAIAQFKQRDEKKLNKNV